ncbi:MAG: hypothetical protein ACKOF9_00445 [Burkholderiales bacterium]
MTVHRLDATPLEVQSRTRSGRWKMLLVLLMCAAPVIASYFTYYVIRPEGRSNYSEVISPGVFVPDNLTLTNLQGQALPASSLKGQWLMVVVAASPCDERCEKYLLLQRQLRETLGREKDRLDKVWLITDEQALRPELAAAVAAAPEVTALRIAPAALAAWLAPASGQALQDHIYLVDPMGAWMLRTPVDPDPAKFKRDIERLLRASSSWDRAGR